MKVWILGAGGQLGKALVDHCRLEGIPFVASKRQDVDVTNFEALCRMAENNDFTHLINCAAFTDVDGAEKREKEAFAVNAHGAENVSILGREMGIRVVHVSTDYVFDGFGKTPYQEGDTPSPVNAYGRSKLEGEQRILEHYPTACIVRTSWIFGRGGSNFISSIFDRLSNQLHVDAVDDQIGRVTYNCDLARVLIDLSLHSGIYHFANSGEVSRYTTVKAFFNAIKERGIPLKCQKISPVSHEAFPAPSKRPIYSVLSTEKVSRLLGRKPRVCNTVFDEYLDLLFPRT
jgi:dTDP-4-dehydrorhamnose reductase